MMNYNRNHQLYLAERNAWLDRHVTKTSVRAILKISSYKQTREQEEKIMVWKLLEQAFFNFIHNVIVLEKEGYFLSELAN